MRTYKTTAKGGKGGKVLIEHLPFHEGVEVEVIDSATSSCVRPSAASPGTPYERLSLAIRRPL